MRTKPSILFRLSMYEVVALDKVACWLLYEIQANCFVVQSLGHRVLRGAEWSQINVAICHRCSPTPPHTPTHTHTKRPLPTCTQHKETLSLVALKVALQWPLCWSMKGNLYSGGYWQYFHDISHSKLHSVPCNKSHYFTRASKGFHTVSVIASAPEEEFIKLRLTPLRSLTHVYSLRRSLRVVFRRMWRGRRAEEWAAQKGQKREMKRKHTR